MMNKVILVGRITKDPEVKMLNSESAVCNFTLACNRSFTKENGEREADFINCVVWRKQAENLGRYVKKGQLIGVEGRIQTRSFEQEGQKKYVTEVYCEQITFLESNRDDRTSNNSYQPTDTTNYNQPAEDEFFTSSKKIHITEDDLPF